MILSFPLAAGGITLAKPIITTLFGAEYAPAIVIMQVAFLPFAIRGLIHAVSSIIYGMKEPVFILKIGAFLIVLSIGLNIWLIPRYGAIGAVIATSIPRVLSLPLYIRFVSKKIGTSWPMGATVRTALAAVTMGVFVFFTQYYLGSMVGLIAGIIVGVIVYVAALLAFNVVNKEDINTFKGAQNILPAFSRKTFLSLLTFTQKFVRNSGVEG